MENEIVLNETEQNITKANANSMSFEQRKQALNAITNFESIWDLLKENANISIEVINVLLIPVKQEDKRTGEVRDTTRCIFVTPNGKSYATSSASVIANVQVMLTVLGEPNLWESPVTCVFTKGESKQGNPFINISF